jgi:hypothetical protein
MSMLPSLIWLAADYHLPATYTYRIPMSSTTHAPTLPTPGPATVRLALLRCSIELFGISVTREEVFPVLRAMAVRIRPPEAVAISLHRLRAHKWEIHKPTRQPHVQESLMLREMAHAQGPLTISLQVPSPEETRFRALLQAVGYWGQTDSFASCLDIRQADPIEGESVTLLQSMPVEGQLQPFFAGLATEFRHPWPSWEVVTAPLPGRKSRNVQPALVLDLYLWPLVSLRHSDGNKLFQRRSLREGQVEQS